MIKKIGAALIYSSWLPAALCLYLLFSMTDESWFYDWPGFTQQFKYAFTERPDYPLIATSALVATILFSTGFFLHFIIRTLTFILSLVLAIIFRFTQNPKIDSLYYAIREWEDRN